MNDAHSSSTTSPLRVRCRPDLISVQTQHKYESAVVVKDPIALKYHRLRPDEFFVLQLLDGQTSLEQLQQQYESTFAPRRVTPAQLNQLLFRFHNAGLTLSDALMQGDRLTSRRSEERRQRWQQHISGILFIRFPGVDPEPLLRRLYPWVRPLLGRVGSLLACLLCCTAMIVFATNWGRFSGEFPRMQHWLRVESILLLMVVIGITKILHEFGHAILCKHFGGECHQIGPMLLVFTPALYCDTSDSWMLPSRWQRAAVGIAGIGTEIMLAALATMIWVWTAPGLTHSIAMNVMLVCSVSTLLFNANPLLRYDGYYVLSDLCDVPNLGERSRKLLSAKLGAALFGVNEGGGETAGESRWLLLYAVLATAYRWLLTLLILWIVSLMLRPYGLESLGRVLCVLAACGLVAMALRRPIQFLKNPARRRLIRMKRVVVSSVAVTLILAVLLVPLPAGVSASGRIVPRSEAAIYITTPGHLEALIAQPGTLVAAGDEVARLANPDVNLRYLRAKGRFESQQRLVESIRRSRFDNPDAANELPAAETMLAELGKQLQTRQQRLAGLTLKSPASGRLVAVAHRPAAKPDSSPSDYRLVSWSGLPTDPENEHCFLEPGTELMSVISDDAWDAELILSQSQVQRISIDSHVKLALESMPARPIMGVVTKISPVRWSAEQHAPRQDHPNAVRMDQPLSTSYLVRVRLSDEADVRTINSAAVTARIAAESISILGRAQRGLSSLLRFRS